MRPHFLTSLLFSWICFLLHGSFLEIFELFNMVSVLSPKLTRIRSRFWMVLWIYIIRLATFLQDTKCLLSFCHLLSSLFLEHFCDLANYYNLIEILVLQLMTVSNFERELVVTVAYPALRAVEPLILLQEVRMARNSGKYDFFRVTKHGVGISPDIFGLICRHS